MSSSSDYFPNYFSLEDIFVTQERVPCTVETNLPGMGKLILLIILNFVA